MHRILEKVSCMPELDLDFRHRANFLIFNSKVIRAKDGSYRNVATFIVAVQDIAAV